MRVFDTSIGKMRKRLAYANDTTRVNFHDIDAQWINTQVIKSRVACQPAGQPFENEALQWLFR